MKITRRELAGAIAGAAAGRAEPPAQQDNREELRKAAAARVRESSEAIAKTKVPIETDPAFSFRP